MDPRRTPGYTAARPRLDDHLRQTRRPPLSSLSGAPAGHRGDREGGQARGSTPRQVRMPSNVAGPGRGWSRSGGLRTGRRRRQRQVRQLVHQGAAARRRALALREQRASRRQLVDDDPVAQASDRTADPPHRFGDTGSGAAGRQRRTGSDRGRGCRGAAAPEPPRRGRSAGASAPSAPRPAQQSPPESPPPAQARQLRPRCRSAVRNSFRGGGPPFHPRLPTWSDSTVRSWDKAEPETADLSNFVALARHSGSDGVEAGGTRSPPSRGDVDTRGQGRIVPGLLGESPRA